MSTGFMRSAAALAVCSTVLLSAGCVVAPYGGYYGGGYSDGYGGGYGGEVVGVAPPAPVVEMYGAPPLVGQIWIGGFWNWVGGRHVWSPGHWDAARPGHAWVPHTWAREGGGWRLHPGHWR